VGVVTEIENKELTAPKQNNALAVFSDPDGLDIYVQQARDYVDEQTVDLSTAAGRKAVASTARKVARLKVHLDDMGKELVAGWKQKASAVDATRKRMRDQLDELRDQVRAPLTRWEEAEEKRVQRLDDEIDELRIMWRHCPSMDNQALKDADAHLEDAKGFKFDERQTEAVELINSIIDAIAARRRVLAEQERIAKEQEAKRKEQERIEAEQREERLRLDRERAAAEKAERERQEKIEAEREQLRLERENVEREKREAEERARLAEQREAQAKADADAAAQRERVAAEQHAAEEKKRASIRRKLLAKIERSVLKYCTSKESAKQLVAAISVGDIDNVQIVE
jgi:chromosome segregation ATPase